MKIEFIHRNDDNRFNEEKMRARFRKAIAFLEDEILELYTGVTKRDLDITIIRLIDATSEQDEASVSRRLDNSNMFDMKMVFRGRQDIILKLAHELCHVMQQLSGLLIVKDAKNRIITWKGEEHTLCATHVTGSAWENDANLNGLKLHDRYLSSGCQ